MQEYKMRKKNDMYIEIKHTSKRKDYRREKGGKNKKFLSSLIVLSIAFGLGITAFLSTKSRLQEQDDIKDKKEQNITGTEQANNKQTQETKSEDNHNNEVTNSFTNVVAGTNLEDMIGMNISTNPLKTFQTGDAYREQTEPVIKNYVAYNGDGSDLDGEEYMEEPAEEVFMPGFIDERTPIKVRGIYVTGPRAGHTEAMEELTYLVDTTELNAMVIDIKNDSGVITYNMDLPTVQEIGANENYISDIKSLIADLKAKDIYLIARVVAFKDPILAEQKPELSIRNTDGTIFLDKAGHSWVNPYKKEVWEYLIDVSKEAAMLGFDEIQFDYIRFSTDSGMKNADFGEEAEGKTKIDIITEFTKYAAEQLKPLGVYVSADVYGTIIDSKIDAEIVGQSYVQMSKYLDYISPMIYPSHYADGSYGIQHPDLEPYNLILKSLQKSANALDEISESTNKAVVRPWLQDFTAVWLSEYKTYGPEEIRAQVDAVYDAGYEEWILWNGSNHYTEDGLLE
jgi:hypothetical protein